MSNHCLPSRIWTVTIDRAFLAILAVIFMWCFLVAGDEKAPD